MARNKSKSKSKSKDGGPPAPAGAEPRGAAPGRWIVAAVAAALVAGGIVACLNLGLFRGPAPSRVPEPRPLAAGTNAVEPPGPLAAGGEGAAPAAHPPAASISEPFDLLKMGNDMLAEGQPAKA